MKTWMKGIILTGAICCAAGLAATAAGMFTGGQDYVANADLNVLDGEATKDDAFSVQEKTKIDSFTAISAELDTMDLRIQPSGDASCYISWRAATQESAAPVSYLVDDGTLLLSESAAHTGNAVHVDIGFLSTLLGGGSLSDLFRLAEPDGDCVTLYVPENQLDTLDIESSTGNVTLDSVRAAAGEISAACGNLSLSDCALTGVSIGTDVGDAQLSRCVLTSCKMETDSGDWAYDGTQFQGTCTLNSDVGDIRIADTAERLRALAITADSDSGELSIPDSLGGKTEETAAGSALSYRQNGTGGASLTITTDCGDLSIQIK